MSRTEPEPARSYAPDFLTELFRNPLDPGYHDAAEHRRSQGPIRGWRRGTIRAVSLVTLVALGFLLAVAYRQTLAEEPSRRQARAGLVAQIKQREVETDALARRAEGLRAEVARQRDAALTGSDAARLRDLEAITGLGRVRGDGVVVRVADASSKADAVTGAGGTNLGRVLDSDLQNIANALWSAGAEAIAINGQRLTATSTIRAAGSAILVDFRPVSGPYEVSAIGPDEMERRFRDSAAARLLRSVAASHGMSFGVRKADDLTLPSASEAHLRYAQPSPKATPTPSGSGASPNPSGGGR
ncbi:DUF881 domain-containing protein [Micromonospora polyrhachis]|uniref:Uncharacterized protein YlxW (UPF0749 family) n=1 Tax=Micromonospora polyrhachis TaxID=1282883 RepID=A0A7W7SWJ8_9ACTN|nr:DUF881 domain-containing protein [Micromonospora polyrhachis]MBB4962293.1 uncharacterized protein YlxW (UPF0749 family) [Micromonospora polyrhachis]